MDILNNLDLQQRKRLNKIIKKVVFYLALGLAYYLVILFTGWKLPCIIMKMTGKYCPGCGITGMCMALIKGDIVSAANSNLLVVILLPFAFVWAVYRAVTYIKNNNTEFKTAENVVLVIVFIVVVAFWIMRNTSRFAWLAPVV